jgi:hypothetical protein
MRRIILACALAGVLSVPAKADETLKFRTTGVHLTFNQNQQVGDVARHVLGVLRAEGTAVFPDGSMGTTLAVGTLDVVVGSGGAENGYSSLTFADGSELWFKYTAALKWDETKNIDHGTSIIIGGKGRYAGAKGYATFEGEFIRGPNGVGQFDSVVNIKK